MKRRAYNDGKDEEEDDDDGEDGRYESYDERWDNDSSGRRVKKGVAPSVGYPLVMQKLMEWDFKRQYRTKEEMKTMREVRNSIKHTVWTGIVGGIGTGYGLRYLVLKYRPTMKAAWLLIPFGFMMGGNLAVSLRFPHFIESLAGNPEDTMLREQTRMLLAEIVPDSPLAHRYPPMDAGERADREQQRFHEDRDDGNWDTTRHFVSKDKFRTDFDSTSSVASSSSSSSSSSYDDYTARLPQRSTFDSDYQEKASTAGSPKKYQPATFGNNYQSPQKSSFANYSNENNSDDSYEPGNDEDRFDQHQDEYDDNATEGEYADSAAANGKRGMARQSSWGSTGTLRSRDRTPSSPSSSSSSSSPQTRSSRQ